MVVAVREIGNVGVGVMNTSIWWAVGEIEELEVDNANIVVEEAVVRLEFRNHQMVVKEGGEWMAGIRWEVVFLVVVRMGLVLDTGVEEGTSHIQNVVVTLTMECVYDETVVELGVLLEEEVVIYIDKLVVAVRFCIQK